ncbi:hypothetical protein Trihar35433_7173 [Trichoderma harzianum]|nr:hypothetical protein Trihar35433_7173 [Trichoderma harzianum]
MLFRLVSSGISQLLGVVLAVFASLVSSRLVFVWSPSCHPLTAYSLIIIIIISIITTSIAHITANSVSRLPPPPPSSLVHPTVHPNTVQLLLIVFLSLGPPPLLSLCIRALTPPLNKPSNPAVVGHLHESGRNEHRLVTRQKRGAGPQ